MAPPSDTHQVYAPWDCDLGVSSNPVFTDTLQVHSSEHRGQFHLLGRTIAAVPNREPECLVKRGPVGLLDVFDLFEITKCLERLEDIVERERLRSRRCGR